MRKHHTWPERRRNALEDRIALATYQAVRRGPGTHSAAVPGSADFPDSHRGLATRPARISNLGHRLLRRGITTGSVGPLAAGWRSRPGLASAP